MSKQKFISTYILHIVMCALFIGNVAVIEVQKIPFVLNSQNVWIAAVYFGNLIMVAIYGVSVLLMTIGLLRLGFTSGEADE